VALASASRQWVGVFWQPPITIRWEPEPRQADASNRGCSWAAYWPTVPGSVSYLRSATRSTRSGFTGS